MPDQDILTLPVARQILVPSFFLSQGQPILQPDPFTCIALLRPRWRLTDSIDTHLKTLLPAAYKLIEAGLHASQ